MAQFCSRCGMRVEDAAATDCPNCKAPLAAPAVPPQAGAAETAATCTVCGRTVPAELLVQYQNQRICPDCKPAFFQRLREGVPGAPPVIPQGAPIPFEADPGIGSFFSTVKLFITSPMQTMRGQKTGEGVATALSYFLLILIPVVIIGQLFNWAAHDLMMRFVPGGNQPPKLPGPAGEWLNMMQHPTLLMALLFSIFAILMYLVMIFINAGIIHAFLRLLGGGSQGYGVTLKAHCYSCTPMLLGFIPVCLNFIGFIWALVLLFMLMGSAHRESTGKGAGAVALDVVICCGGFCALYFFVVVALVGSISAMGR